MGQPIFIIEGQKFMISEAKTAHSKTATYRKLGAWEVNTHSIPSNIEGMCSIHLSRFQIRTIIFR